MAKQFITNIDLNDNQIKNLGYPTEQNDGISKEFLDEYAIDFLNITTFSLSNLNNPPPSLGEIILNANNTELYIHKTDNLNFDCENLITNLDIGSNILIRQISDTTRWVIFTINGIIDNTTYFTISISQLKISNIGFPNTNQLTKVIFFASSDSNITPDTELETQNDYDFINSIKIQYDQVSSGGDVNTDYQIYALDFTGNVNGTYVQNDGKTIVYGGFTEYKTLPVNAPIIRLNKDGTIDNTFKDISITTDGGNVNIAYVTIHNNNIYTTFSGNYNKYVDDICIVGSLARFDINGNIDVDFCINILNFKIVGGLRLSTLKFYKNRIFTFYYITELFGDVEIIVLREEDGLKDNTFNIGTGFNGGLPSSFISSSTHIIVQSDGKIIVQGRDLFEYQGQSINRIVRINTDGTIDNTFNSGSGFFNTLTGNHTSFTCVYVQENDQIIYSINNDNLTYNGESVGRMFRLNSNGTLDNTFISNIGNNSVETVLEIDNKLIIGGTFTFYNSTTSNKIARIFTLDGTLDNTFNIGTGFGTATNNRVSQLFFDEFKSIYIYGQFTEYNGELYNRFISLDSGINAILINQKTSYDIIDNTYIKNIELIGNQLQLIKGNTIKNIELSTCDVNIKTELDINDYIPICSTEYINKYGTIDFSFMTTNRITWEGTNGNNNKNALTIQGNKVLLVGRFNEYNGISQNSIIRFLENGQIDDTFNIGTGFIGFPDSVIIDNNNKIVVGGQFSSYNGTNRNRLARINNNGTLDTSLNIGFGFAGLSTNAAHNVLIRNTDEIICIGGFTSYQGTTRNRIAQLLNDGTYDTSFNIGTGFNSTVRSGVLQSDGKLIVVGEFTEYRGVVVNRIVRINTNGTIDNTFDIGTGLNGINNATVKIDNNSKIVILNNNLIQYKSIPYGYILRLNTDGTVDNTFDGTISNNNIGSVNSNAYFEIVEDNKIIIPGSSISSVSYDAVKLNNDGTIDNTFNLTNTLPHKGNIVKTIDNKYYYLVSPDNQLPLNTIQNTDVIRFNNNTTEKNTQFKIFKDNLISNIVTGSDTYVQYNSNNALSSSIDFTYNDITKVLKINGQIQVNSKIDGIITSNAFIYDCTAGMTQKLDLEAATASTTLSFSNELEGSTYTLIVVQGSGVYGLTLPNGWWLNDTAPFDFTTLADNERAIVTATYLDSEWYFAVKKLTQVV